MKDPIEKIVADTLDAFGIAYHADGEKGNQDKRLDFYLPHHDLFIECKQFHTKRTADQLTRHENVIVIQGKKAALFFKSLIEGGKLL